MSVFVGPNVPPVGARVTVEEREVYLVVTSAVRDGDTRGEADLDQQFALAPDEPREAAGRVCTAGLDRLGVGAVGARGDLADTDRRSELACVTSRAVRASVSA